MSGFQINNSDGLFLLHKFVIEVVNYILLAWIDLN